MYLIPSIWSCRCLFFLCAPTDFEFGVRALLFKLCEPKMSLEPSNNQKNSDLTFRFMSLTQIDIPGRETPGKKAGMLMVKT